MPLSQQATPTFAERTIQASVAPASMTEDAFLGGKLSLLQPEKGYRAGIDAVFLAASIPANAGETVFEAGIGAGVAALCLLARNPMLHIIGIEIAARYAILCEQNAKRNGFGDHVRVIQADVKEAMRRDLTMMPEHGSFAHAYANPPYFEDGKSTPSPVLLKAQAHAFGPDDLELWIKRLRTITKEVDYLVVMAPPQVTAATQALIDASDLVVVPCSASAPDLAATAALVCVQHQG